MKDKKLTIKKEDIDETILVMLASEEVLKKDWLSEEDNLAWKGL